MTEQMLTEPEHAHLTRDHPREQRGRARHPFDVRDDGRPLPRLAVADADIEPELRICPQRARLDLIEPLNEVQRPQPLTVLERAMELGATPWLARVDRRACRVRGKGAAVDRPLSERFSHGQAGIPPGAGHRPR
jgi:hypothetical protein